MANLRLLYYFLWRRERKEKRFDLLKRFFLWFSFKMELAELQ